MDYWHSLLSYRFKIFVACWEIECQFSSQRAILVYDKQGIQNTVVSDGQATEVLCKDFWYMSFHLQPCDCT